MITDHRFQYDKKCGSHCGNLCHWVQPDGRFCVQPRENHALKGNFGICPACHTRQQLTNAGQLFYHNRAITNQDWFDTKQCPGSRMYPKVDTAHVEHNWATSKAYIPDTPAQSICKHLDSIELKGFEAIDIIRKAIERIR